MKLEGVLETIIAKRINEKMKAHHVYDHQDRSCSNRLNNAKANLRAPQNTTKNQQLDFTAA